MGLVNLDQDISLESLDCYSDRSVYSVNFKFVDVSIFIVIQRGIHILKKTNQFMGNPKNVDSCVYRDKSFLKACVRSVLLQQSSQL